MNNHSLHEAQLAVRYQFNDPALLEMAMTHASVAESRLDSNERMEFLGDSVLGLVVCHRIFENHPRLLEGEMTKIKSLVVSRQVCADIARDLGLQRFLNLGKGMQGATEVPSSLPAAAFEAVVAAIYLDGGFEAARGFLLPLLDPLIDSAARSGHQENYKSVLQQHAQQLGDGTPAYRVLDEKGPDHCKCFKVCVEIGLRRFEASWAQSKKRAEQLAALNALRELGVLEDADDGCVRLTEEAREDQTWRTDRAN